MERTTQAQVDVQRRYVMRLRSHHDDAVGAKASYANRVRVRYSQLRLLDTPAAIALCEVEAETKQALDEANQVMRRLMWELHHPTEPQHTFND